MHRALRHGINSGIKNNDSIRGDNRGYMGIHGIHLLIVNSF